MLYTVASTLGSGHVGGEAADGWSRTHPPIAVRLGMARANVNSICAQAGYLWSAVEAEGDMHSFDSARASMTTHWTESGRIAASC
jgi:hypothetical protein